MVVIRNVFRLKFGKAREAVALFKEGIAIQKRVGAGIDFCHSTAHRRDGPVLHGGPGNHGANLAVFEAAAPQLMGDKDWQANIRRSPRWWSLALAKSSHWWTKASSGRGAVPSRRAHAEGGPSRETAGHPARLSAIVAD
jgi:hypothetical protein